jgi:hypothetical protein
MKKPENRIMSMNDAIRDYIINHDEIFIAVQSFGFDAIGETSVYITKNSNV